MSALSITAANVVAGTNAVKKTGVAGATITAGQPINRDPTTLKMVLSDADSATASLRRVDGIALHGASLNQPITWQESGDINLGATLVVAETYILDSGAGGIAPVGDLTIGEYTVVLGVATTASNLKMGIINSGAADPA